MAIRCSVCTAMRTCSTLGSKKNFAHGLHTLLGLLQPLGLLASFPLSFKESFPCRIALTHECTFAPPSPALVGTRPFCGLFSPKLISSPLITRVGERFPASNTRREAPPAAACQPSSSSSFFLQTPTSFLYCLKPQDNKLRSKRRQTLSGKVCGGRWTFTPRGLHLLLQIPPETSVLPIA